MPITSWPTSSQLSTALTALGVSVPSGVDLSYVADQAAAKVHALVGYPFIQQASADQLLNAPYSDTLYLPSWYSVITAVSVGVTETDTTGQVLNIATDCFLVKNSRGVIRAIKFTSAIIGSQASIKITGTAGYSDDIPSGLFQAVLDYGCALAANRARMYGGVLVSIKQGDTEKRYAESVEPEKWIKAAERTLEEAAANYKVFAGVC